jgi:predicted nucleotidyltransferase
MNNLATQQIQVLKTVAEWADRFTCIRKIHIFGSFARGEKFGDIDIAVDYIDDVRELKAVQCYTDVNTSSADLEETLSKVVSVQVGWTGLNVLRTKKYDATAWEAIKSGKVIQCCGKAQLVWTKPKSEA